MNHLVEMGSGRGHGLGVVCKRITGWAWLSTLLNSWHGVFEPEAGAVSEEGGSCADAGLTIKVSDTQF